MLRGSWSLARRCLQAAGCGLGMAWLVLGWGSSLQALPPEIPIHQLARDYWGQQQGLPGSAVHRIFQLEDGYLWMQSSGVMIRFDGARFVTIHPRLAGSEIQESILATALAPQGDLLVRTSNRTLKQAKGTWSEITEPGPMPDGTARVLFQTRSGDLWVGCDGQIYRVRDRKMQIVVQRTSWVFDFLEDRQGRIWVGTQSGIYCFEGQGARYFAGTQDLRPEPHIPMVTLPTRPGMPRLFTALLEDTDGSILVGSDRGLWKVQNDQLFPDPGSAPLASLRVSCFLRDREGSFWVGTSGSGLFRKYQDQWSTFTRVDGLSDDSVLSLLEDREGSLWVGTRQGLDRFRVGAIRTLDRRDGLSAEDICSVGEAGDGSVLAFVRGAGLNRIRDGHVAEVLDTRKGLSENEGGTVRKGRNGVTWIGTGQGLNRLQGSRIDVFTAGKSLLGNYTPALVEDESGLVIATNDLHLWRMVGDRLTPFDFPLERVGDRDPVRFVWDIHLDEEGTYWFAMSMGLYRLGHGEPLSKAQLTGFKDLVNSIGDDGRGYLWLAGTETPGFTRLRKQDGQIVRFTPEQGAEVDAVGHILADASGNLWMNTGEGIAFFDRREVDAVAEGRQSRMNRVLLGTMDGLKTQECGQMGTQPSGCRASDGKMYFTSRKGLVVVDPEHLPRNPVIPRVCIEEAIVDQHVLSSGPAIVIPPGGERLEIHYTALSFRVPFRVRFRYQLVGYDSGWVDAGTRRTAYYAKLPPGEYEFRVIACNDDGLWNLQGESVRLVQKPRLYQTWWFMVGATFVVIGLVYGFFRLRVRQLRAQREALEAEVAQRTQDLRREVDERIHAEQALKEHKQGLEQIVTARTAELRASNERLEIEIRERMSSEEQLRQSQKLESVGRLAGGVAHDFNNLLTVIGGSAELLMDKLPTGSEEAGYCQEIKQAEAKAAALTHQLLAFSRKQILKPVVLDLNALVMDMEKMLRRLLREDIQLMVRLGEGGCCIQADQGQINQVILNLVVNARDAISAGGQIILETEPVVIDEQEASHKVEMPPGAYVRLTVSDTGHGMDAVTLGKIFEPFFTTKELGKGTGLGLSTVFGIVKQSGGHIWTYSEVGKGTSFKLFFPRVEVTPKVEAHTRQDESPVGGNEVILVVEDQSEVRGLVVRSLHQLGYQVLEAGDGAEALRMARAYSGRIDLLFTDIVMPGMNGRELARQMQAERPGLKVVYTTGYTEDVVVQQGVLEAGLALLQKPFTRKSLAACIYEAIRRA